MPEQAPPEPSPRAEPKAGESRRALVLGAGITGLAAARTLLRQGFSVKVLDAADRPGGCLRTLVKDGFVAELGPSTVQLSSEMKLLCHHSGCSDLLGEARPAAKKRYLVHRGRLIPLPARPQGILGTPLLPLTAKLRLLSEPLRGAGPGPRESVGAFFRRRLGGTAARRLGDAMIQGIYAGDPEELAVGAAFPRVLALEQSHGSLIKGLKAGAAGPPRVLAGASGGFEALAARLARGLDLRLGFTAVALDRDEGGFTVWAEGGGVETADVLVLALPRDPSLELLAGLEPSFEAPPVPHAPVAVVGLGFAREQVDHPLDGFGFLAPHEEGRRILGCIFSSSIFPQRAPEGAVLLTAMVGGRRRAELVDLDDDALLGLVRNELEALLGARGEPRLAVLRRWHPGIPQPTAAWFETRRRVEALEQEIPGLQVLGSWLRGVSVPDCVAAGWGLAPAGTA